MIPDRAQRAASLNLHRARREALAVLLGPLAPAVHVLTLSGGAQTVIEVNADGVATAERPQVVRTLWESVEAREELGVVLRTAGAGPDGDDLVRSWMSDGGWLAPMAAAPRD